MKHILYFKENIDNSKFETTNFTISKIGVEDYEAIDKRDNKKYYFDFNRCEFVDENENQFYLKEFLDDNSDLFNYFGEQINCVDVKEENGEYWMVVSDYKEFESYFELDSRTRNDLIKIVLAGEGYEIFQYDSSDFNIDENNFKLDKDDLLTLKIILRLEQSKNEDDEYDYDVNDVKDYRDIADIVENYGIEPLEIILKMSIREGHESADSDAAWEEIIDEIYKFFNLVDGSAKWKSIGQKNDYLWIKFKSKSDAYYAKFKINNYDDSWSDDKIKYSPPYYGYNGKSEDVERSFNNCLPDRLPDYDDFSDNITYSEIEEHEEFWKEIKKDNPKLSDDEIWDEIEFKLDAKKYNL